MFTTTLPITKTSKRLVNKLIVLASFLFVFIININVGQSYARLATTLLGTEGNFSFNGYETQVVYLDCSNGESIGFNYLQRVIINGKTVMAYSEFMYAAGTHQLYLVGTCNGLYFYEASTCSCKVLPINLPTIKWNFFPKAETGITKHRDEKSTNVIANQDGIILISAIKASSAILTRKEYDKRRTRIS